MISSLIVENPCGCKHGGMPLRKRVVPNFLRLGWTSLLLLFGNSEPQSPIFPIVPECFDVFAFEAAFEQVVLILKLLRPRHSL